MTRVSAAVLLLALLLTACAARTSSSPSGGTVRGVVLLGPMCPVETAESPCPDRPLPATTVRAHRGGEVVATAVTDAQGRFSMRLDPGSYTLEAVLQPGGPGMSAKPVEIAVSSGRTSRVRVFVDSGIRAPEVGSA